MPKSDGAIFRIEEKNGKRYRVMYFKNSKGGYTRSKFPKELPPKKIKPKSTRGRGRPKKPTRVTENRKLILENRRAIINNSKAVRTKKSTVVPHVHKTSKHSHMHKPVTSTSRFKRAGSNRYVKRAGNAQGLIDQWKKLSKK